MKQCKIFGNKEGKNFKIKFDFSEDDYLETLCEELNKNNVMMENVERLYTKEIVR